MMYNYGNGYGCTGGFGGLFGFGLHMIIPILLIGLLVYGLIKMLTSNQQTQSYDAMAILDEKLANGELTEEEYKQRKQLLKKR